MKQTEEQVQIRQRRLEHHGYAFEYDDSNKGKAACKAIRQYIETGEYGPAGKPPSIYGKDGSTEKLRAWYLEYLKS